MFKIKLFNEDIFSRIFYTVFWFATRLTWHRSSHFSHMKTVKYLFSAVLRQGEYKASCLTHDDFIGIKPITYVHSPFFVSF